jgi:hypothetical protein
MTLFETIVEEWTCGMLILLVLSANRLRRDEFTLSLYGLFALSLFELFRLG